jgi:hypothetical protein
VPRSLAGATRPTAGPSLSRAVRLTLTDAYYHSWRLVPANLVWAASVVVVATLAWLVPIAILLLPLLALPTAGIFRLTTLIVRGESASFWDAIDAWRMQVGGTLALGVAGSIALVVLGGNTVAGLQSGTVLGWGLATLAAWGLVALSMLAWTVWPIVVDPARRDRPLRDRVRLAALLVLAHPVRIGFLAAVLTLFLAVSAVAIVALVSVSLALAALVSSHVVLPAADRLEVRLTARAA